MIDVAALQQAFAPHGISIRPISEADMPFLRQVYISTRLEEVRRTGWTQVQIEAFLTSQFLLQHQHYQQHYTTAVFLILQHNGHDIGRLYLDVWPTEWRIVDIALLPKFRNQGFGTKLLRTLISLAHADTKPITIHVEYENPARRLYDRLGFVQIDEQGVYLLLEKRPAHEPPSE
jgi:ribosomal protein S18 acetylase RimI-like enzyme